MKTTALIAFALAASLLTAGAAPPVSVTDFVRPATTEVRLSFRDDGTGLVEDFEVEATTNLSADTWNPVVNATITPVGSSPGRWQATVPVDPAAPRQFFRVLKDGVVLTASFDAPTATLVEGAAGTGVSVSFTTPFTGTLNFTIDQGSGPAAGSISLTDATSAFIPVTLDDDASPDSLATVIVNLELGSGGATYALGVNSSITLVITDNDSSYAGTLTLPDNGGEVAVRLLVINQDGTRTVCFKTDGGGLIPPAPPGTGWFFSSFGLDLDDATFSAGVGGVQLPADSTFYGKDTTLSILFAASGADQVTADEIEGTFSLSTTVPDHEHLNVTDLQGTFALYRQPALAAPSTAPN